jgi:hypothetical protein
MQLLGIVLGTPDHARLCAADWWASDESVTYRLHTAPTPHLHERHGDAIRCAQRLRGTVRRVGFHGAVGDAGPSTNACVLSGER